jgi:hypothetical protein
MKQKREGEHSRNSFRRRNELAKGETVDDRRTLEQRSNNVSKTLQNRERKERKKREREEKKKRKRREREEKEKRKRRKKTGFF